jgi:carbon starvation protein CstA
MSFGGLIFMAIVAAILGLVVFGLFNSQPIKLLTVPYAFLAILASLGALHAWGEGQSIPWTTGYLAIVLAAIIASGRQFRRRPTVAMPDA